MSTNRSRSAREGAGVGLVARPAPRQSRSVKSCASCLDHRPRTARCALYRRVTEHPHRTGVRAAAAAGPIQKLDYVMTPRYITIAEAAEYLQVSDRTVRRLIADGELTGYWMGRSASTAHQSHSGRPGSSDVKGRLSSSDLHVGVVGVEGGNGEVAGGAVRADPRGSAGRGFVDSGVSGAAWCSSAHGAPGAGKPSFNPAQAARSEFVSETSSYSSSMT